MNLQCGKSRKNLRKNTILDYVSFYPGCTMTNISKNLDINMGTVYYYIKKLEYDQKVKLLKNGKKISIYKNITEFDISKEKKFLHYQNSKSMAVIQIIIDHPGITNQMLSKKIGLDKSTTYWYIKKFLKDGIVYYIKNGRYKYYYIIS